MSTLVVLAACGSDDATSEPQLRNEIDWKAFLDRRDLHWDRLPQQWQDGPFLGNGELGTLMYQLNERTIRFDVGNSSAHDHRPVDEDDLSEDSTEVLNRGRIFIGHLRLELPAPIVDGTARLSLWDAEATGTLASQEGNLDWSAIVHAAEPVMRFSIEGRGELAGAVFRYHPEEAVSSRASLLGLDRHPPNPPPETTTLADGVRLITHQLHAGGQTAVALLESTAGQRRTLWLSALHSFPGNEAEAATVAAVRAAAAADQADWEHAHRDWWHNYYPSSFVSTGDPFWDGFYWIQQYKLGSATRERGQILDNSGPWLQPTLWNAVWWNLNVQLAYSGVYAANRLELASSLSHQLDINREALARNVAAPFRADSYAIGRNSSGWDLYAHAGQPGGRPEIAREDIAFESGNLLWALHNVDTEVRYSGDTALRDAVLFPLLIRAVNYYRHFLKEGDDGLLHLPPTHSPEYGNVADCSYDLELLHWAVKRLLAVASEQGRSEVEEPLIAAWRDIHQRLVPTHTDANGIMIGRGVPYDVSHRHWSHLLGIYPLRTLTPDDPADRQLIERSLTRWHSLPEALYGYSYTAAASIAAILGDGDRAYDFLEGLRTIRASQAVVSPTTMYSEFDAPVIETPLHAATVIQEMLLDSNESRLRIFPAVPSDWTDIQFHSLRAEGAFLVSARRERGTTQWVFVRSEIGGQAVVEPNIDDAQWNSGDGVGVDPQGNGSFVVEFSPDGWVLFRTPGSLIEKPTVAPVPPRGANINFGLNDTWLDARPIAGG